LQGGAVDGDEAVDVLRGAEDDHGPWGVAEGGHEVMFDARFGDHRFVGVLAQVGAFEQKRVDVVWRVGEQTLKGVRLAAVAAQVPGVQQTPSAGLDEQGVGVVAGVVGQVRRDGERADRERLAVAQVAAFMQVDAGTPEQGGAQNVGGGLADEDRHDGWQLGDQAPVILVAVGDQNAEWQVTEAIEPDGRRQRDVLGAAGPQRPPEVEQNGGPVLAYLDAAATDLGSTAMNADVHLHAVGHQKRSQSTSAGLSAGDVNGAGPLDCRRLQRRMIDQCGGPARTRRSASASTGPPECPANSAGTTPSCGTIVHPTLDRLRNELY